MSLFASALRSPLTFSATTSLGRSVAIAYAMCSHKPDRVPGFMPARFPACDRSWQGNPPVSTSIGVTWVQSTLVRSPRFGMVG